MFNDNITVMQGFQTSVNIAFDLHNKEKIKSFIPTISSIEIFEEILKSVNVSTSSRARLLVGAYGRGKSHIILVMLSLLLKKDKKLFTALLNKVESTNKDLYEYMQSYLSSEDKLLPIIVEGNSFSLTQSFLNALHQTLKNENLEDLMPVTNFTAALNAIEKWKIDYPQTYQGFTEQIDSSVDDFKNALKEFDVDTYNRFIKIYPILTSGSEFNPFTGFGVIELYEKVLDKLKDRGYKGVYIIYDEFSKYLESSIAYATVSDTKLLQDFAEKCDRSGEKQMHLMLISHKNIANYIDNNLPKEKVDGWTGVSGRFLQMDLHNNFSQMYEIISSVILKEPTFWKTYLNKHKAQFEEMEELFTTTNILETETSSLAIRGCYPLHPISTFILPRLSEKVAQNERTLFTFLSSDQKHTLSAFLSQNSREFALLTPDYLYDYFEPLFKKEHYASKISEIYKLSTRVLSKISDSILETKIIKTITVIYIIEQFERLVPTYDTIISIFRDSENDIATVAKALERLIEDECIVYLKQSNGYLKIKESSGLDIPKQIKEYIEKNSDTLNTKAILNDAAFENYIYPIAYNDEMDIIRYFEFKFITASEMLEITDIAKKLEDKNAVGSVFAIISNNDEEITKLRTAIISGKYNHKRIIFILPKKVDDITPACYEYNAVQMIREQNIYDELVSSECDIYIEDLSEVINSFIISYTNPESKNSEYFYHGEKMQIRRKAQLSAKLSAICYDIYQYTPIINNESINKNILPSVAIKSRNKLVAALLENTISPNLGLAGTGQEVSFMRSTLISTGILKEHNNITGLDLVGCKEKFAELFKTINKFVMNASSDGGNLNKLYEILTKAEHGFGLKKGVIPIYIAVAIHNIRKYVVIRSGKSELKISVDVLNSINENPENFNIYVEDWSPEKTEYIEKLSVIFSDYINENELNYNTFNYILSAITRWYISLPRYTKDLQAEDIKNKNNQKHFKFLASLKHENNNARDFLFQKIFSIYGYSSFTLDILEEIKEAKHIFDNAKKTLIKELSNEIVSLFGKEGNNSSLFSILTDWYEKLSIETQNHLFVEGEDSLLKAIKNMTHDEDKFIENLAKQITGLRLDDWNSSTEISFSETLSITKARINDFNANRATKKNKNTARYTLTLTAENGDIVEKTFEKLEYSGKAKLLYRSISNDLEEMGQSMSEQEKRQVLIDILDKMCN